MGTTLYFVGAGLTKSLALHGHPIPAMFDFISTAAEYLFDKVVLTTLASLEIAEPYPYTWEAPMCRTLAQRLLDRNRQLPPDLSSRFRHTLRDRPSESVEDLLDRTGGRSSNLPSQAADMRFQYAVARTFALIDWQVNWHPLDAFLRCQFQTRASAHTFVSFNYDLVLDHAITRCSGRLDLSGIYGFRPTGGIVSDPTGNPWGAEIKALQEQPPTTINRKFCNSMGKEIEAYAITTLDPDFARLRARPMPVSPITSLTPTQETRTNSSTELSGRHKNISQQVLSWTLRSPVDNVPI